VEGVLLSGVEGADMFTQNQTIGGVTIIFDTLFTDIQTDQVPGLTDKKKVGHKITISFKVPLLSNDLLRFALAQPPSNISGNYLYINNDPPYHYSVTVELPLSSGRVKNLVFEKCVLLGATEIKISPGEQTAWEIKFEAVWAGTRYGYSLKET